MSNEKAASEPLSIADSKSNSLDEKVKIDDESTEHIVGRLNELDVALTLAAGHAEDPELSRAEALRLRRKLDWHLLPLLCAIYTVQFIDKNSLGASAILGIIKDNHLTTNEFNNLSSAFYIGYLVFQWPQNVALQHLPVGRWITFNIFLWCLFLGLHPLCHSYGGLFTLRFLLGASEGCMTTGMMLVISMFYTRTEIGERIGWVFQCNGLAVIISGFIAFGAYHATPAGHPNQWQWLFVALTILTFITLAMFVLFMPDNPTTAYFLTEKEKVEVVKRVQENQNGIETKRWKKKQFIEALLDPKTWLFFFYAGISNLVGGVGVQYQIIIQSFGFTTLQTTLLNIPSGALQIAGITTACFALRKFPNSRGWIAIIALIPAVIGCSLELGVPFNNKAAHLAGIWITPMNSGNAIMVYSWVTSTVSGHTKRMTTNAIFFVAYAVGQLVSTQFWKQKYRPVNIVPWSIILASQVGTFCLVLAIRYVLSTENKRRETLRTQAEAAGVGLSDFSDFGYVETSDKTGNLIACRVEKAMLDLTDRENLAFRYVL